MILCPCSVLFIYIFKFKEGPFLLKFTSSLLKYKTRIPYCLTDIKIEVSFLLKIITTCSRKMVPFRTKFHFYHCKQKAPFWCGGCVCFQLCGYCWCWNWHISRSWMGTLSCQHGWWIRAVFFFSWSFKMYSCQHSVYSFLMTLRLVVLWLLFFYPHPAKP